MSRHGRLGLKPPKDFKVTYSKRLSKDDYRRAAEELSCELEAAERRILKQAELIEELLGDGYEYRVAGRAQVFATINRSKHKIWENHKALEEGLNKQGAMGWELVGIFDGMHIIFRRRKRKKIKKSRKK